MVLVYFLQRVREVSFTTMKTLWRGFLIGTDLSNSVARALTEMGKLERISFLLDYFRDEALRRRILYVS